MVFHGSLLIKYPNISHAACVRACVWSLRLKSNRSNPREIFPLSLSLAVFVRKEINSRFCMHIRLPRGKKKKKKFQHIMQISTLHNTPSDRATKSCVSRNLIFPFFFLSFFLSALVGTQILQRDPSWVNYDSPHFFSSLNFSGSQKSEIRRKRDNLKPPTRGCKEGFKSWERKEREKGGLKNKEEREGDKI